MLNIPIVKAQGKILDMQFLATYDPSEWINVSEGFAELCADIPEVKQLLYKEKKCFLFSEQSGGYFNFPVTNSKNLTQYLQ